MVAWGPGCSTLALNAHACVTYILIALLSFASDDDAQGCLLRARGGRRHASYKQARDRQCRARPACADNAKWNAAVRARATAAANDECPRLADALAAYGALLRRQLRDLRAPACAGPAGCPRGLGSRLKIPRPTW